MEQQAKEAGDMFLTLNSPPVTIDEVQRAKELFRYIKIKCDESEEKGLFCLSMRESMRDGFNKHFLPTLEYVTARRESLQKPENIWKIIHMGGYPELQDQDKEWAAFYADYTKTYMERDIRELTAVQDLNAFRQFLIASAARTGEILNYSAIASEIGKDVGTVKHWMSLLEASGIVYLLEPYTSNFLKRAIKSPKLYFRDMGLVCYLTRWLTPENLAYGAMSGPIFETFVVSEILKSFANEGLDYRHFVSYYRGRDKKRVKEDGEIIELEAEIDLIIEENGILYPIEIKKNIQAKAVMTSSFTVLDQISGKKRGMGAVVCNCPNVGMLRDNILQIPVWYI